MVHSPFFGSFRCKNLELTAVIRSKIIPEIFGSFSPIINKMYVTAHKYTQKKIKKEM